MEQLGPSTLHLGQLPLVSLIEIIRYKLSFLFAPVTGVFDYRSTTWAAQTASLSGQHNHRAACISAVRAEIGLRSP